MAEKRIYTHMSERAVRGLERLSGGRKIHVRASPSGGYTVVTEGRKFPDSARVVERREGTSPAD